MEFIPLVREISFELPIKRDSENSWLCYKEFTRVLMSFIILVCLLIDKTIEHALYSIIDIA